MTHLDAIELRLYNAIERLRLATNPAEVEIRTIWVRQIEKELADEKRFLGMNDASDLPAMTDDEILAALAD